MFIWAENVKIRYAARLASAPARAAQRPAYLVRSPARSAQLAPAHCCQWWLALRSPASQAATKAWAGISSTCLG